MLLTFYFGLLLFAGLYRDSLFTNQMRAAYVAVSQIPFVVALATKNNIISMLIGIGWDHMNYIHRFTGRLLVIAANVHAIGYSRLPLDNLGEVHQAYRAAALHVRSVALENPSCRPPSQKLQIGGTVHSDVRHLHLGVTCPHPPEVVRVAI
ncbi:iron reductase [Postia placenta Mad-698-R]|nr:iron reductase [Postia placenta Mad-698-R]